MQTNDPLNLNTLSADQLYAWQSDLKNRDTSPFAFIRKCIESELDNRGLPERDPAFELPF